MAKILDIGEGTLTVRIGFGMKFSYASDSDEKEERRKELTSRLSAFHESEEIQQLEDQLIKKASEAMGFTQEMIDEAVKQRDEQRKANRLEEERGRKARQDKRIRAGR